MSFNKFNSDNTLLVADFNRLVELILTNKFCTQNLSLIQPKTNESFLINQSNNYSQETNLYSLWNNSFDITSTCIGSNASSRSISPCSTIDSNISNDSNNSNLKVSKCKKKLELPSVKTQVDISKCWEKIRNPNKIIFCSFCKNNGEPEHIYSSHSLKDLHGKTVCPLLKAYKCPICGESGKNAHTITYCKKFKASKRDQLLKQL